MYQQISIGYVWSLASYSILAESAPDAVADDRCQDRNGQGQDPGDQLHLPDGGLDFC